MFWSERVSVSCGHAPLPNLSFQVAAADPEIRLWMEGHQFSPQNTTTRLLKAFCAERRQQYLGEGGPTLSASFPLHLLSIHSCFFFSDRPRSMLNVLGGAFGAGILDHLSAQSTEVRVQDSEHSIEDAPPRGRDDVETSQYRTQNNDLSEKDI